MALCFLTIEDGRKLAEMAGYIVPDTAPSGTTDVPVSVNWSAFQEVKKEEEVFTRLKEERITDYIPSSDYGAVIPFMGVDNESGMFEGQKLYGLMDQNGRIICDPVFDDAYYLDDGSLVVCQYVVKSQSNLPDERIGLISKDGSYYTGLVYDARTPSGDGFYTVEKNGITLYKYDPSTGRVGSGKFLKMDDVDLLYCFDGIIADRYIDCADYFDDCWWLIDGMTGKDIVPSLSSKYDGWSICGNFILGREEGSKKETKRIYSFDGKALSDDCYFKAERLDHDGYMMLARTESKDSYITDDPKHYDYWDLVDENGKVITSIENESHCIQRIECMNETLLVMYSSSIEMYDFSGNLLKTVRFDWPDVFYTPSFPLGDHDESLKAEKVPMIVHIAYNSTKLYNLETGASVEYNQDCYVNIVGENVLLSGTSRNDRGLAEGEGDIGIRKDYADGRFYLVNIAGEGRYSREVQIIDANTGKILLEKKTDSGRGYIHCERIHAGKAVFMSKLFATNRSSACDEVTVEDLSGNVVMRYHTWADPRK